MTVADAHQELRRTREGFEIVTSGATWAKWLSGALVAIVLVFAVSGCSRADQSIIFANDCDAGVVVVGAPDGEIVLPAGGAAFANFDSRPSLSFSVEDHARKDISLDAWPARPQADVDGLVVFAGSLCEGASGEAALSVHDDEALEEQYGARIDATH